MTAIFWRAGSVMKFQAIDASVAINPDYAEIILNTEANERLMFVVSDDPDVTADMSLPNGKSAAFDGFLLRDSDGATIERITIADPKSVH